MFGKRRAESDPENSLDKALRTHSQATREQRTAEVNDRRRRQGLTPMHCGAEASLNKYGDWECTRCGDVFA
ncbi:hypothetical protein [Streptomyces sparsogenes]|uniref:Uncharacterized protein n=1 Tax=Streptomyces sparsogenes DSM 40356 TaxID=1331668 RepID=A0A1R1S870_9ACTN|nr:hypothetical protein [Streptomyces sparsogenes]OMI34412.1 hypothetical protein SPAR_36551 [Streptomyces sparsogenes DSM 40356]